MTPLDRAILICGTQSELARRVTGKPATGYVYHWRKNGVTEEVAIAIERAVTTAVGEDPAAAARAAANGGGVTADELLPGVRWERDEAGAVVGYFKNVPPLAGVTDAHA
ncbi:hypothetical protein [Stenotrophomonas sp.]|uniref:hypothetical protein n=1 Tax=Stenotrophomonas sp. TaxID=69392 RepID=UPI002D5AC235|nr:hypothetical protein [Stenotrophomonas sp.]HYQ23964.1 hypothetical protein [Stenotrophomonas sp.]